MEVAASRITERGATRGRRQVHRGGDGRPQEGGLLLMELLRFATAGSVDDGKSTLIGRLLLDTQADLRGPARGGRAHQPREGVRLHEPRAAHRRPARRARAGHHDRRRLPLLRDPAAQVHHRRHARARAVHAQHGHRRVDRRPRDDPASTRGKGVVEQSRRHSVIASLLSGAPPRALRQQDGPRRLRPADVRPDLGGVHGVGGASSTSPTSRSSRSPRSTATTSPSTPPTRRGTAARRCSTTSSTSTSARTATSSTPGSRCSG